MPHPPLPVRTALPPAGSPGPRVLLVRLEALHDLQQFGLLDGVKLTEGQKEQHLIGGRW